MRGAGFATGGLDREMINAAGGLSAFEESLLSFRENFMTEEQRVTTDTADLIVAFGKLGLQLPKSKEDFYALAMGIDTSTSEGKKLFAQLMSLNGKFAEVTDAAKELADTQAEAAEAARKAAEDAAEASRKAAEAAAEASRKAAEELEKINETIVAGLQKNVDSAFSAMQKAYQDLQKVQERFLNYSKSIRAYLDELTGGRSTYISPEERYRIARQEFQRVNALAASGDETALGEITKAGKDFLDASREYNASGAQFQADFASVTSALEQSSKYAENQASIAESQLSVAANSYNALITLNTSTLSVTAAVGALSSTMASYANAVSGLAEYIKLTGYTGGVISTGNGTVAYDPKAPVGSPTNPIAMPKQVPTMTPAQNPQNLLPQIPGGAKGYNPFASDTLQNYSEDYARQMIRFYYQQLLAREPENEGAYTGRVAQLMGGHITALDLAYQFRQSQEYKDLIARNFIPGFAKGGFAEPGIALVGEKGPELVRFGTSAHVSTANQTSGFFSNLQETISKGDANQVSELQALIRLQSAANQQLIKQMSDLKAEMSELVRKAKMEAAA
jgi:hypothetical protein